MKLPEILQDKGTDLDRIKAFSDGVYSICITLLVLSLQIPKEPGKTFAQSIGKIALPMASYLISFVMIGLYWIIHCRLLRHFKAHSRGMAFYNLILLFFVTLVPFTTQLPHHYRHDPLAWSLYFGNLAMVAYAGAFLWWQGIRHGFLHDHTPVLLQRYLLARAIVPGIVFSLTCALVFVNFQFASFVPALTAPLMIRINRHFSRQVAAPDPDTATP